MFMSEETVKEPRTVALVTSEMQEIREGCSLDDDMLDGDLGDGMRVRAAPNSGKKSRSLTGLSEGLLLKAQLLRPSSQPGDELCTPAMKTAEVQQRAYWKLPHLVILLNLVSCAPLRGRERRTHTLNGSLADLSKDELKERLQEMSQVIDALCCELDVTHRYMEAKYKALKILQGRAILDKATGHTKSLLQKSEEKAKALEKEVNSLQWELSFQQVQMKKTEQSWEQKFNGIVSENKTLTNKLAQIERENQQLQAENSALSQQIVELLSTLKDSKPQFSGQTEDVELQVLGTCQCLGVTEACPCSQAAAAATRKQLVQLQQELDTQRSNREEALKVADAFRIAFEQQLRKRSEQFLLLAEANVLKSHHCKPEGAYRSPIIRVDERLRRLLPSSLEMKKPDELLDTLYRLLDMLNDKEEALAHQKKVSIMLANSAEQLQGQLHIDSHRQPPDPSQPWKQFKQPLHPSKRQSQCQQTLDPPESNIRPQLKPPESHLQPVQQPSLSKSEAQELSASSQTNIQLGSHHRSHQSDQLSS
ncbi:coiled-coil domain-containing protein 125 isoform 2-T2 [Pholidichthys leucotaenia]